MKKLLVLFFAVLFVAPSVFGEGFLKNLPKGPLPKKLDMSDLIRSLHGDYPKPSPVEWLGIVGVRAYWKKQKTESVPYVLHNIISIADKFIRDCAKNPQANTFDGFEPKNEETVRWVVAQIEKPIMTGWGEKIIISEYIKENLDEAKSKWFSEERIVYLEDFREILVKYSQPQSEEGQMFLGYLESYRKGIEGMKDLNSSHLVQSTVSLKDAFMLLVKKNPAEAIRLTREIVKPVKAGWFDGEVDVFYIITNHACEVWQVEDELEAFAKTLKELNELNK